MQTSWQDQEPRDGLLDRWYLDRVAACGGLYSTFIYRGHTRYSLHLRFRFTKRDLLAVRASAPSALPAVAPPLQIADRRMEARGRERPSGHGLGRLEKFEREREM